MTQEQLREEFDKRFDVDVYADKINAILDYRGIYDGGKCFNEEVQEHFLEPFHQLHQLLAIIHRKVLIFILEIIDNLFHH